MGLENVLQGGKTVKEVPARYGKSLRVVEYQDRQGEKSVTMVRIENVSHAGEVLNVRGTYTKKEWYDLTS